MSTKSAVLITILLGIGLMQANSSQGDQVSVRHTEGAVHGFLALKTMDGKLLATGDLSQSSMGDRVMGELAFRFKDGSVHEETTEYSQRDKFQILKYHLLQKGPAFKHPMEVSMDGHSGDVTVRYTEDNGNEKVLTERLQLPPDVSNGMVTTILKNIQPSDPRTTISIMAFTPKPRIVKLAMSPEGEESFLVGGRSRRAARYLLKIEIGGVAGAVAPLVGKQPPDIHTWLLNGDVPAFLKSEGPLFEGGPIWRIELVAPTWPPKSYAKTSRH